MDSLRNYYSYMLRKAPGLSGSKGVFTVRFTFTPLVTSEHWAMLPLSLRFHLLYRQELRQQGMMADFVCRVQRLTNPNGTCS